MSSPQHVVVDGSNIATEGRSMPSLQQLDEAVQAFAAEYPEAEITVVVDATFGHRIDAKERPVFDDAVANGEIVSPPAGAIGRGDAFVLRIADKVNATVLSNDSFQEFHGEHEWLFTPGRLIGGKPVPAVGWIFTLRTPVRGIKSREATRDARRRKAPASKKVVDAIQVATREVQRPSTAASGDEAKRRRRRRGAATPPSDPVNDPLPFITFIAEHTLGSEVEGLVESFSSHGAFIEVDGAKCYVPLSALGDPPPRAARDVLNKGETRTFVVQAFDALRRGIELALPGFAHVSGAPTAETVEAEIGEMSKAELKAARKAAAEAAAAERAAAERAARDGADAVPTGAAVGVLDDMGAAAVAEAEVKTAKKASGRKAVAKKAPARRTAAKKVAAGPVDILGSDVPAEVPAKKAATKKVAAKKAAPAKKAAAVKAPAKKVAAKKAAPAKKVAAEKAPAKKTAAKKAAPARKPAADTAPAKKTSAKKAAAKKTTKKTAAS